jgi:hypothetical protein
MSSGIKLGRLEYLVWLQHCSTGFNSGLPDAGTCLDQYVGFVGCGHAVGSNQWLGDTSIRRNSFRCGWRGGDSIVDVGASHDRKTFDTNFSGTENPVTAELSDSVGQFEIFSYGLSV